MFRSYSYILHIFLLVSVVLTPHIFSDLVSTAMSSSEQMKGMPVEPVPGLRKLSSLIIITVLLSLDLTVVSVADTTEVKYSICVDDAEE